MNRMPRRDCCRSSWKKRVVTSALDYVEGVDDVVETEGGGGRDEFLVGDRPGVEVAARIEEPATRRRGLGVDLLRCAQSSGLKGTASSSSDADVAPDSASDKIDLASAHLYKATFAPRRTTRRKSSEAEVIDDT